MQLLRWLPYFIQVNAKPHPARMPVALHPMTLSSNYNTRHIMTQKIWQRRLLNCCSSWHFACKTTRNTTTAICFLSTNTYRVLLNEDDDHHNGKYISFPTFGEKNWDGCCCIRHKISLFFYPNQQNSQFSHLIWYVAFVFYTEIICKSL